MAGILNEIMDRLVEHLTHDCQTLVPLEDKTRARVVRKGKLKDDPEKNSPYIEVLTDPDQTSLPTQFSIGGPSQWDHKFIVRASIYTRVVTPQRGLAWEEAEKLRDRIRESLISNYALQVTSDDGERTVGLPNVLRSMSTEEKGGPPSDWIWETRFHLSYRTERG